VDVQLHARNLELDDRFRSLAVDKVGHAGRVFDHPSSVDVELSEEQNPRRSDDRFRIELTTSASGRIVRIVTAAATPEAALDDAVDRFTRQLRRLKERIIDGHRKPSAPPESSEISGSREEPEIVRTKQFVMKPMSIDEAALQMDLLGHDFFFFMNAATDKQSVLYRRRDGRLGLIEPA
jgi:putative sigma-54 modulation protein